MASEAGGPPRAPTWLDDALLERATAAARQSPRGRRNVNLHQTESEPCNRLLNAIEPGSYVAPHRHLGAGRDESIVVVRGRLGAVLFDDAGRITASAVLAPSSRCFGLDVPHGTFHSLLAIEPGTVFFESKAGPYVPLAPEERAPWAPAEGSPEASAYLAGLEAEVLGAVEAAGGAPGP